MWRNSLERCNWTRLLECFRTLESNLNCAFNYPSRVDVACADMCAPLFHLSPDKDRVPVPRFTPEPNDPDQIREASNAIRSSFLQNIETTNAFGKECAILFEKVLPKKPVFKSCSWDANTLQFNITFRRMVRGIITDIGPRGVSLAKGAVISIPKILKGKFIESEIQFEQGFEPKGSKGPVSVNIKQIGIAQFNDKLYVTAQGKRLPFDKALDTIHTIKWK